MTGTLFLTDTLTAFHSGSGGWRTGASLFDRKGGIKSASGETLGTLTEPGEVVACLPPSGTSCQVLKAKARIGRVVTQNDVSGALEAALERAGGPGQAVISAEPSRVFLDGQLVAGSAIGKPAQQLEMEVVAFLSPLPFLSGLEKRLKEANLTLSGVLPLEEAVSASFAQGETPPEFLFVVDRWRSKAMRFFGDAPGPSALSPVGSGHISSDVGVTFNLGDAEAEKRALRSILGRSSADDPEAAHVALARLDELASRLVAAAGELGEKPRQAVLLGLPISPPVEAAFSKLGVEVEAPGLRLRRTDPAILALADGAERLSSGAVPRSGVTALELDAPEKPSGFFDWLLRNF